MKIKKINWKEPKLYSEISVVLIATLVLWWFDYPWLLAIIIYASLWIGFLIFTGAVAIWRVILKKKYKDWFVKK